MELDVDKLQTVWEEKEGDTLINVVVTKEVIAILLCMIHIKLGVCSTQDRKRRNCWKRCGLGAAHELGFGPAEKQKEEVLKRLGDFCCSISKVYSGSAAEAQRLLREKRRDDILRILGDRAKDKVVIEEKLSDAGTREALRLLKNDPDKLLAQLTSLGAIKAKGWHTRTDPAVNIVHLQRPQAGAGAPLPVPVQDVDAPLPRGQQELPGTPGANVDSLNAMH